MKPAAHQYEDKLLELAYGESHVRGCARCTEALNEIKSVRSTMGHLPMVPAPEGGLDSLFAYAEQAARRNAAGPAPAATWWRRLVAPFAVVTALGVVAVVGFQTKRDSGSELRRDKMALEAKAPAPVVVAAPTAPAADLPAAAPGSVAQAPMAEQGEAAAALDSLAKVQEESKPTRMAPKPAAKVAMQTKSADPAELVDDMALARKAENKKKAKEEAYYEPPAEKRVANMADYQRADKGAAHAAKDLDYAKNDGAPRDQADKAYDKGFGLSAGDNAPAGRVAQTPAPAPAKTVAAKAELEAPPAPVAQMAGPPQPQPQPSAAAYGSSGARGQAVMEPQQAVNAPPPPPMNMPSQAQSANRTSLGMGLRSEENQRAGGSLGAQRQASQNYEADQKQAVEDVQGLLRRAKSMDQQNEPQEALKLAMAALNGGARDQQRLEALTYACKALQKLDSPAVTQYCTMLNREFPNSEVGQQFVRNQIRPAAPSRAKKSGSYREADEEMMKPTSEPATLSK
jgi:hypothetical protein